MTRNSQHDDDLTLFLDRCLGKTIVAEQLRAHGLKVETHADNFPLTESDPEPDDSPWLREVGARGWVILTKDKAIRKNQVEIAALLASGAAAFVLTTGEMQGDQMAEAFLKAIGQIRAVLKRIDRPFIKAVTGSGRVKVVFTQSQLIKEID